MELLTRKRKYLLLTAWVLLMLIVMFTVPDKFLFVISLLGAAIFPYEIFGTDKSPTDEELKNDNREDTGPH